MTKQPVYLDYQATTPLDPRVLEVMMPYLTDKFGNPHSVNHTFGWEAEAGVDLARKQVADLIGAASDEIIFTSGATESNNIALKGLAYASYPEKNHVITVATEHSCVLQSCRALEKSGFSVTYLSVDEKGLIKLNDLVDAITPKTSLVSVMAVNNEIGVQQDLKKIGEICAAKEVAFHTDAAQAVGKIPLNVGDLKIDLLSISGHKLYGPKGIGALYVRESLTPHPLPLFDGGGQEKGLRSGTLSPALCAGLGAACEFAGQEMEKDFEHISRLSDKLKQAILSGVENVRLNGSETHRFPGNLNFTFEDVRSDQLISELRHIALSTGAACSTEKPTPSHVLTALGLNRRQIDCSLRIGIGRMTSVVEIDYVAGQIITIVNTLKQQA
ncbi:MAG: cysteine desulfurase [Emcibacter sp.]|nr:cysteine desulfurase [Emcibacter sp.]